MHLSRLCNGTLLNINVDKLAHIRTSDLLTVSDLAHVGHEIWLLVKINSGLQIGILAENTMVAHKTQNFHSLVMLFVKKSLNFVTRVRVENISQKM